MPLAPKFSLSVMAADAAVLVFSDTTGTYNALSNPGGYGAPNPEKAAIKWLHKATVKVKSSGTFPQTAIVVDPSAVADSTGQMAVSMGGLFTASSHGVPYLNPLLTTYPLGTVLWDNTLFRYVRVIAVPSGVANAIGTVAVADILFSEWAYSIETSVLYAFDVERVLGWMLKNLPATDSCDLDKWLAEFERVRMDSEAIRLMGCRKHYNNALILLARYQNNFYKDIC